MRGRRCQRQDNAAHEQGEQRQVPPAGRTPRRCFHQLSVLSRLARSSTLQTARRIIVSVRVEEGSTTRPVIPTTTTALTLTHSHTHTHTDLVASDPPFEAHSQSGSSCTHVAKYHKRNAATFFGRCMAAACTNLRRICECGWGDGSSVLPSSREVVVHVGNISLRITRVSFPRNDRCAGSWRRLPIPVWAICPSAEPASDTSTIRSHRPQA